MVKVSKRVLLIYDNRPLKIRAMIQKHELRIGNILINPLRDHVFFIIRTGTDIDEVYVKQEFKG
jgi:hypothetical protein